MNTIRVNDHETIYEMDGLHDGNTVKSEYLITSVRVRTEYGHDRVQMFNRGASCDVTIVKAGDGKRIAERLIEGWRAINVNMDGSRHEAIIAATAFVYETEKAAGLTQPATRHIRTLLSLLGARFVHPHGTAP